MTKVDVEVEIFAVSPCGNSEVSVTFDSVPQNPDGTFTIAKFSPESLTCDIEYRVDVHVEKEKLSDFNVRETIMLDALERIMTTVFPTGSQSEVFEMRNIAINAIEAVAESQ